MKKYSFKHLVSAFLFGSLLFSSVTLAMVGPKKERSEEKTEGTIQVSIINQNSEVIGSAAFSETKDGVRVRVIVTNLPPGKHGIHIHEKAFQDTDFTTAGEHLNPDMKKHGFQNPEGYHLGDMVNLEVSEEGKGNAEFFVENANLNKSDPRSMLGRSIIIHANEDDYMTDPAGNSGERIAGGNIS